MKKSHQKSLDHLVLPVGSLKTSRKRLQALGFTVAPDGYHPFGTKNACVFFENGTYLEPLAIGDDDQYAREMEKGNGFLSRDHLYRQRNGDDGFSLIALTSNDAAQDRAACLKYGFDCGKLVSFRRDVQQRDGSSRQIAIDLFIASIEQSPDLALFSCQWLSKKVFDDAHKRHANGALGVKSIVLSGADDEASISYLETLAGQKLSDTSELALANSNISAMSADQLQQTYGLKKPQPGLRAVAIEIKVQEIRAVKMIFFASGIKAEEFGEMLVVQPADGQGYALAFVERTE